MFIWFIAAINGNVDNTINRNVFPMTIYLLDIKLYQRYRHLVDGEKKYRHTIDVPMIRYSIVIWYIDCRQSDINAIVNITVRGVRYMCVDAWPEHTHV